MEEPFINDLDTPISHSYQVINKGLQTFTL